MKIQEKEVLDNIKIETKEILIKIKKFAPIENSGLIKIRIDNNSKVNSLAKV